MIDYLTEAFKKLDLLCEEDFNFTSDEGVEDKLTSFVADDIELPKEENIYDVKAKTDDDLQSSYEGKVILECDCCHTRFYKDQEEITIDEESNKANIEEECPVCHGEFGYNIIGKIEAYDKDRDIEAEAERIEDAEEDETEVEINSEGDEEEANESFKEALKKALRENSDLQSDESLNEALNEVEVNTDDGNVTVKKDEDKVTVNFDTDENTEESSLETDLGTEEEASGDEMIAPLTDEEQSDIGGSSEEESEEETTEEQTVGEEPEGGEEEFTEVEEESTEGEEETEEPSTEGEEETEEEEVKETDNESFDYLGKSFLTKIYENVNDFTTTDAFDTGDQFILEGVIKFSSGASKKTQFIFENARETKRGKLVMEGMNKTFSNSKKAFRLKGTLTEGVFTPESMIYNYKTKQINESNESIITRVYGRVATKK